ncbi:putative ABC transport system permease protein [Maridesulfovibrio ferrireducens]|uniref:Putative ABC transport system permease protein n=1 Tax=Maridesulfovibrio ferrireducens TaxID=246191 RepID=A0A1G9JI34_9BACT|nr:ABC transporter permease [Maridesulfovibrio ferrireducens]SDL36886.1 putative ABC transport system permease protein [Maridesulfovibrio ferrireducens]
MRFRQFVIVAFRSITRNRMRSLLTMLGIIIGLASVIALVALGKGSQADIKDKISSLGTNLIMVKPGSTMSHGVKGGAGSRSCLSMDDVVAISNFAPNVGHVSPVIRVSGQVIAGSENWSTTIEGVDVSYPIIRNYEVALGSFFTSRDIKVKAKVAVLGQTVVDELFYGQNPVGMRIRIGAIPFDVVGVLSEKGQSAMGNDQDDIIFVPSTTALYRMSDGETVHDIMASAVSESSLDLAQSEIENVLRKTHRISSDDEDDFEIRNQTEIVSMATQVTSTLTILLSTVAGVSLLVGGIGVMNIMLVSVTERTREIGILLAIGARSSDILTQFLLEAVILSLSGGIIGILTGLGIAIGLGSTLGIHAVFDPFMMFASVVFTVIIGVFFGYYPAQKASRLNPIDAMRYD